MDYLKEIVEEFTGDISKFKKWIKGNTPFKYIKNNIEDIEEKMKIPSWLRELLILYTENNFLKLNDDKDIIIFRDIIIKYFPIFFFPYEEYRFGFIINNPEIYEFLRSNKKLNWKKFTKDNNKWLKSRSDKKSIHIDEFCGLYMVSSYELTNNIYLNHQYDFLSKSLEVIKNKIELELLIPIQEKVFNLFLIREDGDNKPCNYTDYLAEIFILNFFLSKEWKLISFNYKFYDKKDSTDADFEMEDSNGEIFLIEVKNIHLKEENRNNLFSVLRNDFNDKYRDKKINNSTRKGNRKIFLCQLITGNYVGFNEDIIKIQNEIYNKENPFQFKNNYDTFYFFTDGKRGCLGSFKNKMLLINNKNELTWHEVIEAKTIFNEK